MFKFFRKIRQQLLAENKFSKYMLYATGEIVLVVIGILIALQINDWNDGRKKEKLKNSYRISLMNDLSLDTLMLGGLIAENYKTMKTLDVQRRRFLGPDTPIDTLIKIARSEFEPELHPRFRYNRNTLNALIASGNIDLFHKGFNEMLLTLIAKQDNAKENSSYYADLYSTKLSRYTDDYPVSGHQNSSLINSIWTDVDKKKFATSFISLTDIKGFAHYRFNMEIENVKEQTALVLKQINSQNL